MKTKLEPNTNIKISPYHRRLKAYRIFLYQYRWWLNFGKTSSIARVLAWQTAFNRYRNNRSPITGEIKTK